MRASIAIDKAIHEAEKETAGTGGASSLTLIQRRVETVFDRILVGLPIGMVSEFFSYGWQKYCTESSKETLGDFADLLRMEYDDFTDRLSKEDWSFVSDVVSEYATELDIELLQYVMTRVVDHKAIDYSNKYQDDERFT